MISNLERYKKDLEALIDKGEKLQIAMNLECYGDRFQERLKTQLGNKAEDFIKKLPNFKNEYQHWYTEAKILIKQLAPDRLGDFAGFYEKPKKRTELNSETYRIEDYLHGLRLTIGFDKKVVVAPDAALSHFDQQLALIKGMKSRFESSLFDIRQLLQADLFDSELEAARELAAHKFTRAAGAMAGVVLERHLGHVCANHQITISKKNPTISDFNEALKGANVVDTPQWRFNQHLADIRNLCDHSKTVEPSVAQVDDLITGVMKVIKTIY